MGVMCAQMTAASSDRQAFAQKIRQAFSSEFSPSELIDLRILFSVEPDDQSVRVQSDWGSVDDARKHLPKVAAILSQYSPKHTPPDIRIQTSKAP